MIHKVYTVFDAAAKIYMVPFYAQNAAVAIRMFTTSVNDVDHSFAKFPEDYTLFELGDYDDEKGMFTLHEPRSLGCALEYLNRSPGVPAGPPSLNSTDKDVS